MHHFSVTSVCYWESDTNYCHMTLNKYPKINLQITKKTNWSNGQNTILSSNIDFPVSDNTRIGLWSF